MKTNAPTPHTETMSLNEIAHHIEANLTETLQRSGMMFRLFMRVKTLRSMRHKMKMKGDSYRAGKEIMQDIIGLRVVLYFPDDVETLNLYLSSHELVRKREDELDVSTFRPQRLNITRSLPEAYVEAFRKALPEDIAPFIDNTYEVQIRTIFSEGWHEIEHDMRYKCKQDWVGCEDYSRRLNGVSATLEMAEWSIKSIFHEMAYRNYKFHDYRSMLRNKMRIRLQDDDFSPAVSQFLNEHPELANTFINMDRMVFMMSLLGHKNPLPLTYDNILFLFNRMEGMNDELQALESPEIRAQLEAFLLS